MSDVEARRTQEYVETRGNLAVVDVRPSLVENEVNEARFWIVGHDEERRVVPEEVVWSAGPRFPVVSIRREDDPRFCATYHYFGSMLIQAQLKFSDGHTAYTYVYANVPEDSS
jgi:hypothetical protein